MSHLTEEEVGLFVSGRLVPTELQRAVRHLLTGCAACREKLGYYSEMLAGLEPPADPEPAPRDQRILDKAIDRGIAAALRQTPRLEDEKAQLERLLAAARKSPQGIPGVSPKAEADLQGWPLVEALLHSSYEARFRDIREMLFLAFSARIAAQSLDPEIHGAARTRDTQARVWAELGNAYRLNEQFENAEEAFAQAEALLDEGTGDALLLARLLDLRASLHRSQRRLSESLTLLERVYGLYIQMGETHLAGRALITRGINTRNAGRPQEAMLLLRQGLKEIDAWRDPQLAAIGEQVLLDAMVDSGEYREAAQLLLQGSLRQAFAGDPLNLARLRWVEGKIAAGFGKLRRSERVFLEVREFFRQRSLEYDAALVGLELAGVWLRQGKAAEVQTLAHEILDVFQAIGVHSEAVKAVRYLHEACAREQATPVLVSGILGFLRRLEWEPRLRFAP